MSAKNFKILTFVFLASAFIVACSKKRDEILKPSNSKELMESLKVLGDSAILFGHQDDLAYGIGWEYEPDRSDIKETAGDYPALFGWELGGLELGHKKNLDTVPFDKMREFAIKVHEMGGINTFSWHPYSVLDTAKSSWTNDTTVVKHIIPGGSRHEDFKKHLDKVAQFFSDLKTDEGQQVPFIFRPWHEMDGGWFWWGNKTTTPEEMRSLFRFTVRYLREEKGLDFLSAYSPDKNFSTEEEYLTWYPGDDFVEIIGLDNYADFTEQGDGVEGVVKKIEIIVNYAQQKNKVAALTETGSELMKDSLWFTQKLGKAVLANEDTKKIAYLMLWRNEDTTHFFSTYPKHNSAPDFKKFAGEEEILLLEDWNEFKKRNSKR